MERQDYVELAKTAWNEAAPVHWRVTHTMLDEIKDPEHEFIHAIQVDELARIGIRGARVAHLNCNNGRETIAMRRLGAASCVGFDIAEGFIEQARQLADAAAVGNCTFVCSDVYQLGAEYDNAFDLVVITAGAIAFMPDLEAYFSVARRLLRDNGKLTVYDAHPVTRIFLKDRDRKNRPLEIVQSYFSNAPVQHDTGLDYQGGTTYEASPVYYFQHTLGDVVTACVRAGFAVEKLSEHDRDPSQARSSLEQLKAKLPLSYILTCSPRAAAGS